MKTKADLINDAYSALLMTNVTAGASANDVELAFNKLNSFMHELNSRNMKTGYNFLDDDINSLSGVRPWMNEAISYGLAMRLCTNFGIEPPATLIASANASMSNLSAQLARVYPVNYPSRAPVGSGQRWLGRFRGHYGAASQYSNTDATQDAVQFSSGQYKVDFSPYLQLDELLTGFTQQPTSGINVLSSSFDGNIVTLNIQFEASVIGQVNIVATGNKGTVVPRSLNFNIASQVQIGVAT